MTPNWGFWGNPGFANLLIGGWAVQAGASPGGVGACMGYCPPPPPPHPAVW